MQTALILGMTDGMSVPIQKSAGLCLVDEVWLLVNLIDRLMERLTRLLLPLTAINLPVPGSLTLMLLPCVPMNLQYDGAPMMLQVHEEMSLLGVPMNCLVVGLVAMRMRLLVDWGPDLLGNVLSLEVGDLLKIVKSVKIVGNFDSDCFREL